MTDKQLIKALRNIKKYCEDQEACAFCKFYFDNDGSWGDSKWIIDDKGAICYLDDNAWVHYKDIGGIELRPMPEKLDIYSWFKKYHSGGDVETRDAKCYGWNKCIDEILGETE